MEDLRREIITKRFTLKNILGDKTYNNDIIISIGGFNVSAVSPIMQDKIEAIQRKDNVEYDEFCVLNRPFPWFRVLIPGIDNLPYKQYAIIQYCEITLVKEDNIKLVTFKCPVFSINAEQDIQKAVTQYIKKNCVQKGTYFVLGHIGNNWPWCQILLTNVENLFKHQLSK